MKGDYYRNFAEHVPGDRGKCARKKGQEAYERATEVAESLPTTHPTRLALALNYSVFFYEILNLPEQACKLAKVAFDSALENLDQLEDEEYKEATLYMQLLRDNLTLWTTDIQDDTNKEV
eukprot:TRINITY_DN8516_c0_g1_i1.p1 TRINITY_DN8516_c0_g1~~TRINITY_DN8516_c0_g1_i1.p1  ORF type:complete len:120 (+),score=24.24 TRINITY_DN8516_c0_g1_i1:514-873(+)